MVTRRDAFTGLAALGAGALVVPGDDAPRIGVVDLFRVLQEAAPFKVVDEQMKAWIDQEQKPLKAMKDALNELEARIELLDAESQAAREARRELELKGVEFKFAFNAAQAERLARLKSARTAAFERSNAAIATVAKEKGLKLVLQARGEQLSGETEAALSTEIYLRTVLYADAALDITSDVLTVLNR